MSVLKLFDTNTILEPIKICICGKKYRVDDGKMLKYSVENINGKGQLCINGVKVLPLIEIEK